MHFFLIWCWSDNKSRFWHTVYSKMKDVLFLRLSSLNLAPETLNLLNDVCTKILFLNFQRIKITQQSITVTSLEKYSLNRNTCMPLCLYLSSEHLSPTLISLCLTSVYHESDSDSYHRTTCSIKCKDSLKCQCLVRN